MVAKTPPNHSKRAADTVSDGVGEVHAEGEGHEVANDAAALLLEEAVDPVARAMGYEVVLLEWLGGRGGRIARIYLDHPNGISLDDCTRMSRIFSNALDAAEADPQMPALAALLAQPYTLEVSSPGVDRPLVRLSHFARAVGSRAVVKTRVPIEPGSDQRTFHGHIVGTEVDPAQPDDDRRGTVRLRALEGDTIHAIALPDVRRANLVYELPGPAGQKHLGPSGPKHSGPNPAGAKH
jgi:ribosome maturation factor RimP